LIPGSNGIYDIAVDDKTVFSKTGTKLFPGNDEIVEFLKNIQS
jgi:predicted Rdx family selenoprotein